MPAPTQEATGTLIIYEDPNEQTAKLIQSALMDFRLKYPDVKIEYRTFPDVSEEDFIKILSTDLMAGSGPDVVLWMIDYELYFDIYKMMKSGVFVDLNPFVNADPEFPWDVLNASVLDAGVFGVNRYFFPLDYWMMLYITTQENMDIFGLSFSEGMSLDDFAAQLKKFQVLAEDNSELRLGSDISSFLLFSGLSIVNYTDMTVSVRSEEFRKVMELCATAAAINAESDGDPVLPADVVTAMREHRLLLNDGGSTQFPKSYRGLISEQTPVMFPMPNVQGGKPVAMYVHAAAIPKTSANQRNAYNFLKILLSKSLQGQVSSPLRNPVSLDSLKKQVSFFLQTGTYTDGGVEYTLPDQETVDEYVRLITDVSPAPGFNASVWLQVMDIMQPYFDGVRSYESCLNELENALRLYISE